MEIEAEKTIQQIEAGNWLRAQLSRRDVLEALGLAAIAAACAPKTSSLSPTPEVSTPASTPEPTATREAELIPKEPTPEEKIHAFMQEVLKPEVYHPVGPPKLIYYKQKNLYGTLFAYQYEWNMELEGRQLKVLGIYSESIKGDQFAKDGLPISINIRILTTQKQNISKLIPSNMNQVIGEYFTLPATVPPWRHHPLPNTLITPLETLWDNPDGTKEGRLVVVFGDVTPDRYANYYLDAEKIFKDFPGYNEETLFYSQPQ